MVKDNIFCCLVNCFFHKRFNRDEFWEFKNSEGLVKRGSNYFCDIIGDETCVYLDTDGKIITLNNVLDFYKSPILVLAALIKFNEKK